jgi:16S rRNA (adenine1518-N6/adenine1519-N6)-dimethyltransferase
LRLDDPALLSQFLRQHGVAAAKSFGQHFLCSSKVVDAILDRLDGIQSVIEIGPGPGILTSPISDLVGQVVAYEIDERMLPLLADSSPKVDVRKQDALTVDMVASFEALSPPRALVSNMPYYITGPLIGQMIKCRGQIEKAVLMMQKEVADRFIAPVNDSERGAISVKLQALFEIEKVIVAPPGAFSPPPKVTSMVLEFRPREGVRDTEAFFKFVSDGFSQARKTVSNNLRATRGLDKALLEAAIVDLGLSESIRPHQLTLEAWRSLYGSVCPHDAS